MLDEKRFAVLIDADNVSSKYIKYIIDEVSSYGVVTYKRIYADWTTSNNNHWKDVLLEYSINPIQQYRYTTGKNSSDSALIIDAMDILYSDKIDGFCIVSSDSDFTKLATRLRESGMQVIGMGEQKTPKPFVSACNRFKYLDVLAKTTKPKAPEDAPSKKKDPKENIEKPEKAMTSIETIKEYVVKTIIDLGDDDFGMNMGNLGHQITKMYPDFDTRNFGHSKFAKFLEELGLRVVINQNKQIVYLDEASIPENEKPVNEKPVNEKPPVETKAHVVVNHVKEPVTTVKSTDDYFKKIKHEPAKPAEPKPQGKKLDRKTRELIMDVLRDASRLGIGLNLEYVHELILRKKPDFTVEAYGYTDTTVFFNSLEFIQARKIRDGGELLYLKPKFMDAPPIKRPKDVIPWHTAVLVDDEPTAETVAEEKAEPKAEPQVEEVVTKVEAETENKFKITKIQDGIPNDKQKILKSEANTDGNKIVAPQKIDVQTQSEKPQEKPETTAVVQEAKTNADADAVNVPVFDEEYKAKVLDYVFNTVKEKGKNGVYIGELGKLICATYTDFDVRGFGYPKLSSFLKNLDFIKLKAKGMSRRNIWAYFVEK